MTSGAAEFRREGYYAANFYVFVACDCHTDLYPVHTAALRYRYGRPEVVTGRGSLESCASLRERVAAVDGQWSTVCN